VPAADPAPVSAALMRRARAVTPGGGIRNRFETAPGAAWSGWGDGFGPRGAVTAASATRHADGRMEVFAVAADGSVWNRFEAGANGAWSGWSAFAAAGTVKP